MDVSCIFFPGTVFDAPLLAPLALLLDLLLGDPPLPWPHPVVFQGRFLGFVEKPCQRLLAVFPCPHVLGRLLGAVVLLGLVALTSAVLFVLLCLPVIHFVLALYFAWAGLAMGSLLSAGKGVAQSIRREPMRKARRHLSFLVSRDTRFMDRPLMRKTLADTLSENFTDALTAPFFWLLLTGPLGLWIYKAVSTGDSMWGYMTPRFRFLGCAFARMDDCLAFIPARLSIVAVSVSDIFLRTFCPDKRGYSGRLPSFNALHREALGMPSPNSGCSMAVFAWLLSARMAGPSVYFGEYVPKPWLGPPKEKAFPWDDARLSALLSAMRFSAFFGMTLLWLFCVTLTVLF
ncbi:MAG: cobalamin biosynthesis protein [Desulfovibrio sp.]|nr:cobalamin biosynthesis protein [Desulfovibrio sp.]